MGGGGGWEGDDRERTKNDFWGKFWQRINTTYGGQTTVSGHVGTTSVVTDCQYCNSTLALPLRARLFNL